MKNVLIVLSIIALIALGSPMAHSENREPDIDRIVSETVLVDTTDSCGSAVVVKNIHLKGHPEESVIVTAAHVVGTLKAVTVTMGSIHYPATVTAVDAKHDIAILTVEAKLPCAEVAKPYLLRLLDNVYVAGFPDGYPVPWVQAGRIGCADITGTTEDKVAYAHCIGIVCAAQPGMSGGGVYDKNGRLVGIFTLKVNNDSLGAFVPISEFYSLLPK